MADNDEKVKQHLQQHNEEQEETFILDERYRKEIQEFQKYEFQVGDIDRLSQALRSHNIVQQHYGIMGIQKLLYEQVPAPIQRIIDSGIAPILAALARQTEYPQLQMQASAAFAIIPTGNNQHCQIFQELDGVAIFAQLLNSSNKKIVEQAVYAFSYILEDSYHLSIIRKAGVDTLVNALHKMTEEMLIDSCCYAINSLCREIPSIGQKDSCKAIFTLCQAIAQEILKNREIIFNLFCWVLSYKQSKEEKKQAIIKSGVLAWIVKNLGNFQGYLLSSSLRILIEISMKDPQVVCHLLSLNILQQLQAKLLDKENNLIQSYKLLSTMALTGIEHAQAILKKAWLMKRIFATLKGNDFFKRQEAFKLFSIITVHKKCETLFKLLEAEDVIKNSVDLLHNKLLMIQMLENFLRLLSFGEEYKAQGENILLRQFQSSGGVTIIQKLSIFCDQEVLNWVTAIVSLIKRKQQK